MSFIGKWDIFEMEMWDENYFNMGVQAYIEIEASNFGSFQFGLVSAQIDGKTIDYAGHDRFEFTFEGNEECEPTSGSGWEILKEKEISEVEIRVHSSDYSTFLEIKVK